MNYLKKLKFQFFTTDLNVFKKNNIFIAVYVNDLLVIKPTKNDIITMKHIFNN